MAGDSRTDSVGTFPHRDPVIRLVGAILPEQQRRVGRRRRYLGLEVLARPRLALITTEKTQTDEEVPTPAALTA